MTMHPPETALHSMLGMSPNAEDMPYPQLCPRDLSTPGSASVTAHHTHDVDHVSFAALTVSPQTRLVYLHRQCLHPIIMCSPISCRVHARLNQSILPETSGVMKLKPVPARANNTPLYRLRHTRIQWWVHPPSTPLHADTPMARPSCLKQSTSNQTYSAPRLSISIRVRSKLVSLGIGTGPFTAIDGCRHVLTPTFVHPSM